MADIFIVNSESVDPWYNLAVEEYLLDTAAENQSILYLWQNRNTVVIGKNQNPWKECQTKILEEEGGYLARRLSGGGAVYHDLGNLNFTFIMNRDAYNLEKQLGIILRAVQNLGIPAVKNGRNDLTVNGSKFSGNAFCFRRNNAYHHGTILIAGDLEKMAKNLQGSPEKIRSKGVESVRSQVVNLTEYYPGLTIAMVKNELNREFAKTYSEDSIAESVIIRSAYSLDQAAIRHLYRKYASWEWRYGETPNFVLEMSTRFCWGGIEIGLKLEKGIIREVTAYSDAMDGAFIGMLPQALTGKVLHGTVMADCIRNLNLDHERCFMQEDIANWLIMQDF